MGKGEGVEYLRHIKSCAMNNYCKKNSSHFTDIHFKSGVFETNSPESEALDVLNGN